MVKFNGFVDYIKYEKRYSKNTVIAYIADLEQFNSFLIERYPKEDFLTLSSKIIRSWIVTLVDQGDKPRTINRKITSLRSYYRFLLKNGIVSKSPLTGIKMLKIESNLPEFIDESGMDRLFEEVKFDDSFEGALDECIIELFYGSGIRLSELVNFKISGIDYANSQIKVLGKRNKERIIPINNNLKLKLLKYQKYRESQIQVIDPDFFFILPSGKKIYEKFVYRRINYYLSLVTTKTKRSPHVLRHTFATHMLNKGADLNIIKEILGHANLSATQVYTHNSIDKLKSVYKQAHPKA